MRMRWKRWPAALALAVLVPILAGAVAWAADLLTVTDREAVMRKDKKAWSPKVGTLKEKDKVTLVKKEEPWLLVELQGVQGWINQSSVSDDPNVVTSGTDAARGAKATMASEAGRGFNPAVEAEYRKGKPDLDATFKYIDSLEKVSFPEDKVVSFLKAGKLIESLEGGAN